MNETSPIPLFIMWQKIRSWYEFWNGRCTLNETYLHIKSINWFL